MIKILKLNNKNYLSKLNKLIQKRKIKSKFNSNIVNKILHDVRKNGDKALLKYEKKYNKNSEIIFGRKKIIKITNSLKPNIKKAIDLAYNRIFLFHSKQNLDD